MTRVYAASIAPPVDAFCTRRMGKGSKMKSPTRPYAQLVLCSENAFFSSSRREKKEKTFERLFMFIAFHQRSPLYASTRLLTGYVQSWGRKRLACWMRKRKIDKSSFGFVRSHTFYIAERCCCVVRVYVRGKREAFNNSQNVFFSVVFCSLKHT